MNENLNNAKKNHQKIGIFDSGCGGLTVLRALKQKYPHESYVYVGDLARLPYGTKSPDTVKAYCESLARLLLTHDLKAMVIACNTASTYGTQAVQKLCGNIPVIEMILPASLAAIAATRNHHIAVLATIGTVQSKAYVTSLHSLNPAVKVTQQACQLLVALAEEGWVNDDIARLTLKRYLDPIFDKVHPPDTLILGCTHFPLFHELIIEYVGKDVRVINSGEATAANMQIEQSSSQGHTEFFVTDNVPSFVEKASRFSGYEVLQQDVKLVDITNYL